MQTFTVSKKIASLKCQVQTIGRPAGLTLIITKTRIFHASQKQEQC